MSYLSAKTYVANQLPTVSITGTLWKAVVSSRQRLKRGKAGFNAFVMLGRFRRREDRLTAPRASAEKEAQCEVELLLYAEHSDAQTGGDSFDVLIENTCQVFRAGVGNPTLTDAVTGQVSYLTDLGEVIDVDLLPFFFTDGTESRVGFQAVVTLMFREVITPA